jgi:hypothetical protein
MVMWKFEAGKRTPSPEATVRLAAPADMPEARMLEALFLTFKKFDILVSFGVRLIETS